MAGSKGAGALPIGAIAVAQRSLAPDLARGAMLLLIALANAPLYLYGAGNFGTGIWVRGHPALDQVVLALQTIFVRGRAYPMFAFLFGYGIVQLLRRLTSSEVDELTIRKLVRRRGYWMLLIGFFHALLLFSGDIIGAYGLLAVLLAEVLIRARDRTLLTMAACWTIPVVLFRTLDSRLTFLSVKASATPDPVKAAGIRVLEWVHGSIIGAIFSLVPALLLGVWAARRRLLDEPQRHRKFLLRVAVLGWGRPPSGDCLGPWCGPRGGTRRPRRWPCSRASCRPWPVTRAGWVTPRSPDSSQSASVAVATAGAGAAPVEVDRGNDPDR
jgi:uncharacterized membrane protein YeiB